jgi:HSP90 family molecular chaperone
LIIKFIHSSQASASKLAPIQGAVDVNLVAKLKDMEENGKRTQERFVKLQAQFLELQKKNVELKDKLDQSEAAHSATKGDLASAVSDSSKNAQASMVVASNNAEMNALKV